MPGSKISAINRANDATSCGLYGAEITLVPSKQLSQAIAQFQRGALHQAEVACRNLLAADDRDAGAWHLLSLLAERAGDDSAAREYVENAISLVPDEPVFWNTLATRNEAVGRLRDAEHCLRQALRLRPDYAIAHNNLGEVFKRWGRRVEATAAYRQALELAPEFAATRSNLLMSLLYDPELSADEVIAEHRRLGAWWHEHYTPRQRHARDSAAQRRLRIGYVSPDLREHAVMRFFEPLLAAHDRQQFEIYLYSECPQIDEVGQRLRSYGDTWRVTWLRSTTDVADEIEQDGIDLLVDLAGHTRHNRLDLMALRPAPVQLTYLGYPCITGLTAIDYRLTDSVLNPEADDAAVVSEQLLRLSAGVACFRPPDAAPAISPSSGIGNGYVQLASHHPLIKLNDQVLACWCKILELAPRARLAFFRSDLRGDAADRLQSELRRHGFPEDRVEIRAVTARPADYLAQYADIDLILDAFPFTGHTMTCESLWMGVPIVTLRGHRPEGRLSASVLEALGLETLIANSPEDYVGRAVAWIKDQDQRARLRRELRELMRRRLGSANWITGLETAYRQICPSRCQNQPPLAKRVANAINSGGAHVIVWPGMAPNIDVANQLSSDRPLATASESAPSAGMSPDALARFGELCEEQGRIAEAQAAYERASHLEPWVGAHPLRLGNLLTSIGRTDDAAQQYRQAGAVEPQCFPAWAMLGQSYANEGRLREAESAYQQALAVRKDPKLRIVLATLLPQIYESFDDVARWRNRLLAGLEQLQADRVHVDPTREVIPNFFLLAYQGGQCREIQRAFASLFRPPASALGINRPSPAVDARIRVGIISEYFCNHTIGTLNRGFVTHLDRSRFHLTVISANRSDDETARHYREQADRFVRLPTQLGGALATMRDLQLDILFYADLGMSCLTLTLACSRLAPVQCVTWGHPMTTGLPTIDYFLSGELYETPEADDHYTERLIRLPGLQTCYPRPQVATAPRSRADLGLPAQANLYGCPQTLFKMHPEFDRLLAEILRRDSRGQLVMIEGKHAGWTEQLRRRWQQVMPDVIDRVLFIPSLPRGDFLELCRQVDVLLDPIQVGGGNTTLEGLAMGTPVVTCPTPFLRSRLALGMYRHIDWTECVAAGGEEYVDIAVRLGTDVEARRAASQAIGERSDLLFEHTPSIRAFEEFFVAAHEAESGKK